MSENRKQEIIKVWRPPDLTQLELRCGFAVARPIPRHWHEEYQFCLIQAGTGDLNYRGSHLPTPPASLFMVYPGEVHSNRSFDDYGCSYRTLFIEAGLMQNTADKIFGKKSGLPYFPTAVIFDREVIRQYLDCHFALEQATSSLERQALLLDLLTVLLTRFAESPLSPPAFGKETQVIKRACDYLIEHFAENVSLDDLAQIANLSPYHLNRVFSKQIGMPPHSFQTQVRVSRAKALLRDGEAIPLVAFLTGFADQSHLTRHFKRLVGVPPGQYQQNSKNVQDNR